MSKSLTKRLKEDLEGFNQKEISVEISYNRESESEDGRGYVHPSILSYKIKTNRGEIAYENQERLSARRAKRIVYKMQYICTNLGINSRTDLMF